jgi:hypothetical protein
MVFLPSFLQFSPHPFVPKCLLGLSLLLIGFSTPAILLQRRNAIALPEFQAQRVSPGSPASNAVIAQALSLANHAWTLSQTARSIQEWDQIAQDWTAAIALMQSIPPESPQRLFAQQKAQEYYQNLGLAQQHTIAPSLVPGFPTLGSAVLDEQWLNYGSYVASVGTPDILIVGSSRALQGIDAQQLQQTLVQQGYRTAKVYNFSVNGATAQVVSLVLQQLLTPAQLPKLIVWADNSRAFNSGRVDRTYELLTHSPGYQALKQGTLIVSKSLSPGNLGTNHLSGTLDAQGFLAVNEEFNPELYYQQYRRVPGQYDDAYSPFSLVGIQTDALRVVSGFARSRRIPLILVSLPLSQDYLDSSRLNYEQQFQTYLQQQGQTQGFLVVDLLLQWLDQDSYFADPSHLNRRGAKAIAQQLATHPAIPWNRLIPR